MKCLLKEQLIQRTGITPDETQEEPGTESPHSARNLHVPVAPDPGRVTEHRRVKWPPASKERQWLQFDDDVDTILESAAKGDTDGKLKTMATIIISLAVERFGTVEKLGTKTPYMNNRRAEKISQGYSSPSYPVLPWPCTCWSSQQKSSAEVWNLESSSPS